MNIPFNLRNGIKPKTVFDENSVSKEFKIALSHLFLEFIDKNIFLKSIPSKEILV
ncbi:hypothetical protein [Leptospira kanakyensis]|uniref:hypothetical protein n=1 Tax=Leptospira kanakyensis TaxID=2484968 RepID=UPI00223D7381|nr:hypothetical protein [Leptospira kanakyensis]MCW7483314.1 hypothetical protein [Leptospira kanakyensis]